MYNDELQYDEVIKTLHGLKQAKAPPYFEADLMRRINSGDFAVNEKRVSFFSRLVSPFRLIPSAALSLAGVALLMVLFLAPENKEVTPFAAQPKIIKDADLNTGSNYSKNKAERADEGTANDENVNANSDEDNPNLVYKPVYLTPAEKAKVKELKEKVFQNF
ncbi:MAG: hypothetical protein Q8903_10840, partial [Bacteroidota bacterium]|nr:hypothetical protein [Bacteroidota bacterium]